ncbi:Phospholipase D [Austwickia sp. TVS 96-490-7B]|uniref:hypothetical protein n=1 Tax=Austwickia sp. TVS 96-490-7B TaxID=2830843 RepID=UPI001C575F3E|nr:hypothetical protein [Austwickia sp. TVS 96-490-7B]MBW3085440.1 Phospholipase D [Austwickia sp. TVS 96-490-7B]
MSIRHLSAAAAVTFFAGMALAVSPSYAAEPPATPAPTSTGSAKPSTPGNTTPPAPPADKPTTPSGPKPIFAVEQRARYPKDIDEAIKNGANAIQIQVDAHRKHGWYATTARRGGRRGESVEGMLKHVAKLRQEGKTINFVWLDLRRAVPCKTDVCKASILRDLARTHVQKHGVRVIYGFNDGYGQRSWHALTQGLNDKEAISVHHYTSDALGIYAKHGKHIKPQQRIIDYGVEEIGNCTTPNKTICYQLKQADAARKRGELGQMIGWTTPFNPMQSVDIEVTKANVNILLAALPLTLSSNRKAHADPMRDINNWVKANPKEARMATQDDKPW